MKHLLNTLYVMTQGAYLSREGETVLVKVDGETKLRVPVHTLGGIVCFGVASCSPPLMGLCAERNVAISFLSERGRFLARVEGPVSGNVLLRREQYRQADNKESAAELARVMVVVKVANCRTVLLRAARERPEQSEAKELLDTATHLAQLLQELADSQPIDSVRGREGDAARRYFSVFDHLITVQKEDFFFRERSRRPPLDNMNALLSFLYTLLVHDVRSALEGVGLDPAVGYLHADRPGRPGLALDIMEEFRPFLADRLVLSLVNRQQVKGKGFRKTETGAVTMDDETRKEVVVAYQKRKQEEIQHPFLGEKVAIGLLPHVQALLLARYLRGDLDGYPPFFWK
ncbi:MAG: type I-C CRISPR-associated endonuclease Cas1 [Chloroflexi bacterium]|nr:type I-C CRISPR-associated endonuclease Cas1 [Chloroflexota bacterium]